MSKYFTIIVGNSGSYFMLNSGNTIVNSMFIETLESEQIRQSINKELKKYSRAPIHIILDNVGQSYNKRKFPAISIFDVKKIAERKFNYEIPKGDLKEKRFLGRDKIKKEWEFMFISSPIDDFLQDWLNLIEINTNILQGIYMLPLECEGMLATIKKTLFKKKRFTTWNIMLFENKVSGFREITFLNGLLSFTRILNIESDESLFLNDFKTNISRTIEYLKRFSNNFKIEDLSIFVVVSDSKKIKIETMKNNNIHVYTVSEFSKMMKRPLLAKYQDGYCDTMLQNIIMHSKKILTFSNREMKSMKFFSIFLNYINIFKSIFVVGAIIGSALLTLLLIQNKSILIKKEIEYKSAKEKFDAKKKNRFGNEISNFDNIIDVASFYTDVNGAKIDCFDFVRDFSAIGEDIFITTSFRWARQNFSKDKIIPREKSTFTIEGNLVNKSGKIDSLFKIYEDFSKNLKDKFTKYNIVIPSLPKNINFNTSYYSFPLKLEFTEN